MDVTPLVPQGSQIIQSYAGGRFKISNVVYETPVMVFPDRTVAWDVASDFIALNVSSFSSFLSDKPDVILLGTGKTHRFFTPDLRRALKEAGLSVETMDTGAACRTFNVLMAEGRRIVALLLPA